MTIGRLLCISSTKEDEAEQGFVGFDHFVVINASSVYFIFAPHESGIY